MNREYHKWYSQRLGREMELLVFGHTGARVLVFPTRQGRFYDYENWGMVRALGETIEAGNVQLYCLDSLDSEGLYCQSCPPEGRIRRHNLFEEYVLREVLPFSCGRNPTPFLIAHGCSIGAYHAVNIAFRHPSKFGKVVALSGRYDLTKPVGPFEDLFNGHYDQDIYFHTPNHYLKSLDDPSVLGALRQMEVTIAVGETDPFYESTSDLSYALHEKNIPHTFAIWDGEAHRARYWRQMVKLYL